MIIPSGSIAHFWKSVFGLNGIINGAFFADAPVNWLDTDRVKMFDKETTTAIDALILPDGSFTNNH